jgi:hypothetical protein
VTSKTPTKKRIPSFLNKKSKKGHKPAEIKVFLTIFASGYGSVLPTNGYGFGSGRSKNLRILRIRIQSTAGNYEKIFLGFNGVDLRG